MEPVATSSPPTIDARSLPKHRRRRYSPGCPAPRRSPYRRPGGQPPTAASSRCVAQANSSGKRFPVRRDLMRVGGLPTRVEDRQPDEPGPVAVGERRHEVAADITVDDIEAADGEPEADQHGEEARRPPAHLGAQEALDDADEAPAGLPFPPGCPPRTSRG